MYTYIHTYIHTNTNTYNTYIHRFVHALYLTYIHNSSHAKLNKHKLEYSDISWPGLVTSLWPLFVVCAVAGGPVHGRDLHPADDRLEHLHRSGRHAHRLRHLHLPRWAQLTSHYSFIHLVSQSVSQSQLHSFTHLFTFAFLFIIMSITYTFFGPQRSDTGLQVYVGWYIYAYNIYHISL